MGFPGGIVVKNPSPNAGDSDRQVQSLGQEDRLEEEMATHFSIPKIPWTGDPDRLQSLGTQRVGHN